MDILQTRIVRCAVAAAIAVVVLGTCVGAVLIYRLPTVGSLWLSSEELKGKRITFSGQPGVWIAFPTDSKSLGQRGGAAEISWMARKGILPTRCSQGALFDACWGSELSTIQGGNWNVERGHYLMVGRLYVHYKPVPQGTAGAISLDGQEFCIDAATCAGDYTPDRK